MSDAKFREWYDQNPLTAEEYLAAGGSSEAEPEVSRQTLSHVGDPKGNADWFHELGEVGVFLRIQGHEQVARKLEDVREQINDRLAAVSQRGILAARMATRAIEQRGMER
jgi:hypothetical protein